MILKSYNKNFYTKILKNFQKRNMLCEVAKVFIVQLCKEYQNENLEKLTEVTPQFTVYFLLYTYLQELIQAKVEINHQVWD